MMAGFNPFLDAVFFRLRRNSATVTSVLLFRASSQLSSEGTGSAIASDLSFIFFRGLGLIDTAIMDARERI